MTISIGWTQDLAILLLTFTGRWNWKELDSVVSEGVAMTKERNLPFDLIVDLRQTSVYEPNAIEYVRAHYSDVVSDNLRLIFVVGADYFTQVLWKVFTALPMGARFAAIFCETLEEAIERSQAYSGGG